MSLNVVEEMEVIRAVAEVREERRSRNSLDLDMETFRSSSTDSVSSFCDPILRSSFSSSESACPASIGHDVDVTVTPYVTPNAYKVSGSESSSNYVVSSTNTPQTETSNFPVTIADPTSSEPAIPDSSHHGTLPVISITALPPSNQGPVPQQLPSFLDTFDGWGGRASVQPFYDVYPNSYPPDNNYYQHYHQQHQQYMGMQSGTTADLHQRPPETASYGEYIIPHMPPNDGVFPDLLNAVHNAMNGNPGGEQVHTLDSIYTLNTGEQVLVLPPSAGHDPQNLQLIVMRPSYHLLQIPMTHNSYPTGYAPRQPYMGQQQPGEMHTGQPQIHHPHLSQPQMNQPYIGQPRQPSPYVEPRPTPASETVTAPHQQAPVITSYTVQPPPIASTPIPDQNPRIHPNCNLSPVARTTGPSTRKRAAKTLNDPFSQELNKVSKRQRTSKKPPKESKSVPILPLPIKSTRSRGRPKNSKQLADVYPDYPFKPLYPPQKFSNCGSVAYVNEKQYNRIIKRREAREKMEAEGKISSVRVRSYAHESRHLHAISRSRVPNGRFGPAPKTLPPDT